MSREKGHSGYKKLEELKRKNRIRVMLTDSEVETLEKKAAEYKLDVSKYIRLRVFRD